MLLAMRRLWRAWKGVSHHIIAAQNWVLMALVYVIAVAPVALFMKLTGRKLVVRPLISVDVDSYWEPHKDGPLTMDRAQRMF